MAFCTTEQRGTPVPIYRGVPQPEGRVEFMHVIQQQSGSRKNQSRSSPRSRMDTAVSSPLPKPAQIDPEGVKALTAYSAQCHTSVQFKRLLEMLKTSIPYTKMTCGWGDSQTYNITHVRSIDFPRDYVSWYLSTKMIKRDPTFHEWMKTKEVQISADVFKKYADQSDPELIQKVTEKGLLNSIAGGVIDETLAGYFVLVMKSYEACHAYKQALGQLIPSLYQALKVTYPTHPLTDKQKNILMRIAMGDQQKQIARDLKITVSTIKKHISVIHEKLYSTTDTNAVWIAAQRGLI